VKRFLRPRTIDVLRHERATSPGRASYSASVRADETVILTGVAANIFASREARPITTSIPTGTMFRSLYKVVFRAAAGVVQSKDVIRDDLGNRYQVMSLSQGWFGVSALAELMEV
jgi:hypothetical protein